MFKEIPEQMAAPFSIAFMYHYQHSTFDPSEQDVASITV